MYGKKWQEALKLKTWISEHSDVLHNKWEDPSYEDTSPLENECIQIDPLIGRESDYSSVTKKYGRDGLYTWDNGDNFSGHMLGGVREGWGVVTSEEAGLEMLSGDWVAGTLQGYGRLVTSRDTEITQAWFRGGCLHGYVRKMVVKKFRTFTQIVSWLGRYHSGVATGYCWQWQVKFTMISQCSIMILYIIHIRKEGDTWLVRWILLASSVGITLPLCILTSALQLLADTMTECWLRADLPPLTL